MQNSQIIKFFNQQKQSSISEHHSLSRPRRTSPQVAVDLHINVSPPNARSPSPRAARQQPRSAAEPSRSGAWHAAGIEQSPPTEASKGGGGALSRRRAERKARRESVGAAAEGQRMATGGAAHGEARSSALRMTAGQARTVCGERDARMREEQGERVKTELSCL